MGNEGRGAHSRGTGGGEGTRGARARSWSASQHASPRGLAPTIDFDFVFVFVAVFVAVLDAVRDLVAAGEVAGLEGVLTGVRVPVGSGEVGSAVADEVDVPAADVEGVGRGVVVGTGELVAGGVLV